MANFVIGIGTVTSRPIVVNTTKAMTIVDAYLERAGVTGLTTTQQKVDALAVEIVAHVRDYANEYMRLLAIQAAERDTPLENWE